MASAVRFSIIIATLGRENELVMLLNSLAAQTLQDFEIIVVDQNDHDRIHALCINRERLTYIHSDRSGLSLARNLGIQGARGEYLVFPDDDATLQSDFIEKADDIISGFPDVSIFSGIVLNVEDNEPFSRYMDSVSEELTYCNFDKFMSTTMIIHKRVFREVGDFDEEMGVGARWGGSEESELLLRGLGAGLKAYYSTGLVAYHPKVDFSTMDWRLAIQKGYNYGLGRGALFRKLVSGPVFYWIPGQWILSLLKSAAGMAISMVSGQANDFIRHFGALCGRVTGFVSAKQREYRQ